MPLQASSVCSVSGRAVYTPYVDPVELFNVETLITSEHGADACTATPPTEILQWIDIKVQRPPSDINVLVWGRVVGTREHDICCARYLLAQDGWSHDYFVLSSCPALYQVEGVTHWMYCPNAP